MRDATFNVYAAVAIFALALGSVPAPSNAATVFPSITGQNLNGQTLNLPSDFQAPASIVFIAFVRAQQAQVDTWKAFVADVRRRYPPIGAYEVPTLPKVDALFRWFIDGGMRRGIPDTAARDVTITLYIDKGPFDDALGIASESDITVLLLKPTGAILWRTTGAFTAAKGAGLMDVLGGLDPVDAH